MERGIGLEDIELGGIGGGSIGGRGIHGGRIIGRCRLQTNTVFIISF